MKMDFIKFFQGFNSHVELGMSKDIQEFWKERKDIKNYDLKLNPESSIIITIKMYNFTRRDAKNVFFEFIKFVGYDNVNFYICKEDNFCMEYLYYTAKSNDIGVKMEIVIK